MPSATFDLFHRAILERKQVVCLYHGLRREICPIILGYKGGVERVLVYQFAGESSKPLPRGGISKCFDVDQIRDATVRDGPWHSGSGHQRSQTCVDDVYIDVNLAVPNQPGRRGL